MSLETDFRFSFFRPRAWATVEGKFFPLTGGSEFISRRYDLKFDGHRWHFTVNGHCMGDSWCVNTWDEVKSHLRNIQFQPEDFIGE